MAQKVAFSHLDPVDKEEAQVDQQVHRPDRCCDLLRAVVRPNARELVPALPEPLLGVVQAQKVAGAEDDRRENSGPERQDADLHELQQNGLCLSFPYVCPEPVLVKRTFDT